MSMNKQLFAILSIHTISGRLCSITMAVWSGKSHKVLDPPVLNQEHVDTVCHYKLGETFSIANGFSLLLYHAFYCIVSFPN